jgi:hypothetical protein
MSISRPATVGTSDCRNNGDVGLDGFDLTKVEVEVVPYGGLGLAEIARLCNSTTVE